MPGSHATRRRHHKPLHSVCAIADSAGAWRARSSADAGDPPRWVPQMPTWEAPGKRILLFLGRTQVPVVGGQGGNGGGWGDSCSPASWIWLEAAQWGPWSVGKDSITWHPTQMAALHHSGPSTRLVPSWEKQSALSL